MKLGIYYFMIAFVQFLPIILGVILAFLIIFVLQITGLPSVYIPIERIDLPCPCAED